MARLSPLQRKAETDLLAGRGVHVVQGLARGLSVLRAFRGARGRWAVPWTVAPNLVCRPPESRLTQTLTALGYLAYVPRLGRYTLGAAIASLCHSLLFGVPHRHGGPALPAGDSGDGTRLPVSLGARDTCT